MVISLVVLSLQQPTLSDMTMYEMNFSLLVEDTLKNLVLPEYRQIIVEVGQTPSRPVETLPAFSRSSSSPVSF